MISLLFSIVCFREQKWRAARKYDVILYNNIIILKILKIYHTLRYAIINYCMQHSVVKRDLAAHGRTIFSPTFATLLPLEEKTRGMRGRRLQQLLFLTPSA